MFANALIYMLCVYYMCSPCGRVATGRAGRGTDHNCVRVDVFPIFFVLHLFVCARDAITRQIRTRINARSDTACRCRCRRECGDVVMGEGGGLRECCLCVSVLRCACILIAFLSVTFKRLCVTIG